MPVGLNLSAKDKYRGEVLVNFGEPIHAADFLPGYPERKKECINELNAEIEKRIQMLILHIPQNEQARLVDAVKPPYHDHLRVTFSGTGFKTRSSRWRGNCGCHKRLLARWKTFTARNRSGSRNSCENSIYTRVG